MQLSSRKSPWTIRAGRQPVGQLLDQGDLPALRLLPLAPPPLEGALDVALAPAEVAQADSVGIDPVEIGEHVDQRLGRRPAHRFGNRFHDAGVAQDQPVDEAHDVERRAGHRLVAAQPDHRRDRHRGAGQGGHDAVLPAHVVGRREQRAERRAAQHEALAGRVGDRVGEVRSTAGDEREPQRRRDAGGVGLQPGGHTLGVDPFGGGLIGHEPDSNGPPGRAGDRRPRTIRTRRAAGRVRPAPGGATHPPGGAARSRRRVSDASG